MRAHPRTVLPTTVYPYDAFSLVLAVDFMWPKNPAFSMDVASRVTGENPPKAATRACALFLVFCDLKSEAHFRTVEGMEWACWLLDIPRKEMNTYRRNWHTNRIVRGGCVFTETLWQADGKEQKDYESVAMIELCLIGMCGAGDVVRQDAKD